jgi:hypothetical protein
MKSDKKERNSKESDSTSEVRSPPIKSFGRNCIGQSNWYSHVLRTSAARACSISYLCFRLKD